MSMVQIVNIVLGVLSIGFGAIALLAPRYAMEALKLQTAGDARDGLSELRAASGGAFVGLALAGLAIDPSREVAAVATVRRCLHTLKGGARVSGLMAFGDQVHELETALERLLPSGQFTPQWLREAEMGAERLATTADDVERSLRAPTASVATKEYPA